VVVRGIAAFDCNYAMGYKGGLPWPPIPEDMAEFRRLTLHKPVIMGRGTWESIGGRPLDHRVNVVVSSTLEFRYPNQTPPGVWLSATGACRAHSNTCAMPRRHG
jgi:dihydrofolate reductase